MKPSDSDPQSLLDPPTGPQDVPAESKAAMPGLSPEPGLQPEAGTDLKPVVANGAAAFDALLKDKAREKHKDHKDKDKGHGKKKKKKSKEEIRKADPWQRYKALLDTLKSSQDLVDLADHKARFALMIMGALNAAILFAGTRSELLVRVPVPLRPWLYLYFAVYAAIAIYFLLQAVETLRPRRHPPLPRKSEVSDKDESLGLRFFAETLRYDPATYAKAWSSVRVSQLNAELTGQVYTIARINDAKYAAVARLYTGLQAITVLTAAFLMALGAIVWIDSRMTPMAGEDAASASTADSADSQGAKGDKAKKAEANPDEPVKIKAGRPGKGGWAILGEPERFEASGVREPSGIAFSAARKSFFVVGDEGTLVEFSKAGKVIGQLPASGNLEDVAVHTPSGRLVLLSEKKGELVVFDPVSQTRTGKFKIDNDALLGEAAIDKNQGFEGLAFRPEAGHPGGGVFYLVHQRAPAVMVSFAFDPTAATGTIGAGALIKRTIVPNRDDLTAATYDAVVNRLFVISDSKDRLAMLNVAGDEEAEIVLPGAQQEGLTFDADGNLWIADDRAGLLVFRGARARIQAAIKNPPPEPSPAQKNPAGTEN